MQKKLIQNIVWPNNSTDNPPKENGLFEKRNGTTRVQAHLRTNYPLTAQIWFLPLVASVPLAVTIEFNRKSRLES